MSRFAILAAVLVLTAGAAFWFLTRDEDVTSAGSTRLVKVADFESPTYLSSPGATTASLSLNAPGGSASCVTAVCSSSRF
jgi:hypothetical protein